MNVGIDIDFTITELPELFSILSKALRAAGHKVYVVSYRSQDDLEETEVELRGLGMEYDGIYLSDTAERIGEFKSRLAVELDLDMFFDDMPEALVDLPDGVKRIWVCDPSVYDLKAVTAKMLEVMRF